MKIAFDIDDTILVPSVVMGNGVSGDNVPNYDVIAVYKWFQAQGNEMILWSGSLLTALLKLSYTHQKIKHQHHEHT